eukprot:TRINITY_DN30358_c0_g1_i1.p1 TRINITY_DN30358_c0_g1~~TRINITY_DN30358_c0_g1_i1.p1  ORF type:complete len:385 (+),score=58.27 TRINITY_DN30358_c0_g1_i1:93-1247(+)
MMEESTVVSAEQRPSSAQKLRRNLQHNRSVAAALKKLRWHGPVPVSDAQRLGRRDSLRAAALSTPIPGEARPGRRSPALSSPAKPVSVHTSASANCVSTFGGSMPGGERMPFGEVHGSDAPPVGLYSAPPTLTQGTEFSALPRGFPASEGCSGAMDASMAVWEKSRRRPPAFSFQKSAKRSSDAALIGGKMLWNPRCRPVSPEAGDAPRVSNRGSRSHITESGGSGGSFGGRTSARFREERAASPPVGAYDVTLTDMCKAPARGGKFLPMADKRELRFESGLVLHQTSGSAQSSPPPGSYTGCDRNRVKVGVPWDRVRTPQQVGVSDRVRGDVVVHCRAPSPDLGPGSYTLERSLPLSFNAHLRKQQLASASRNSALRNRPRTG